MLRRALLAKSITHSMSQTRGLASAAKFSSEIYSVHAQVLQGVCKSYRTAAVALCGAVTLTGVLYVEGDSIVKSRDRSQWLNLPYTELKFEKVYSSESFPAVADPHKFPTVSFSTQHGPRGFRVVIQTKDANGRVGATYCSRLISHWQRIEQWKQTMDLGKFTVERASGGELILAATEGKQTTFLTLLKTTPGRFGAALYVDAAAIVVASVFGARVVASTSRLFWKRQFNGQSASAAFQRIMTHPLQAGMKHGTKVALVAGLPVAVITCLCLSWRHVVPMIWPDVDLDPEYTQDVIEGKGYSPEKYANVLLKSALVSLPVLAILFGATGMWAFRSRAAPLLRQVVQLNKPVAPPKTTTL